MKLGPQGTHSRGKVNPHDQGDLVLGVSANHRDGIVELHFGSPVQWLGFEPDIAVNLATAILKKAEEIKKKSQ